MEDFAQGDLESDLALFEVLAEEFGTEFDASSSRDVLTTAAREGHAGSVAHFERMIVAGLEIGFRFTPSREGLRKAMELIHPEAPLMAWKPAPRSTSPGLENGFLLPATPATDAEEVDFTEDGEQPTTGHWFLFTARKGRSIRVRPIGTSDGPRWMSLKQVCGLLGLKDLDTPAEWAVVTSLSPCESARVEGSENNGRGSHGSGGSHASAGGIHRLHDGEPAPLRRLLALLRSDWTDIRVVIAFAVAAGLLSLATPLAVEALVTTIAFNRLYQQLVVLALILATCLGFAAVMRLLQTYVVEILQQRLFVRMVSELSYRLPRVRREAYDAGYDAEDVNRFFDLMTVQKVVSQILLDGVSLVLGTLVSLVVLAFYHPFLLGFDLVFLATMVVFVFILGRGAVKTSIQESFAKYDIASWLEDMARLPRTFRSEGGSSMAFERADVLCRQYLVARKHHFRILFRQIGFAVALQAVASGAMLGLGGWLVMRGQLTLGQLVAAELMVNTIAGSFAKLGKHLEGYYDLMAAVNKLGHLLDLPIERSGGERLRKSNRPAALRVVNLSYAYPRSHHPAIADLSFALAPGERLAVTGPPGSGRSTLAELLYGLRSPDGGRIEWDGIDLRDLSLEDLRRHTALVSETEILQSSILENVRAGRHRISLSDIRRSLEAVGLLDEILELPAGMHTVLTSGGSPLSQSQAIRLMLARAVVDRPRLLIIDQVLDFLAPDDRLALLAYLVEKPAPWTLIVGTSLPEVIHECDRKIELGGSHTQANGYAGRDTHAG